MRGNNIYIYIYTTCTKDFESLFPSHTHPNHSLPKIHLPSLVPRVEARPEEPKRGKKKRERERKMGAGRGGREGSDVFIPLRCCCRIFSISQRSVSNTASGMRLLARADTNNLQRWFFSRIGISLHVRDMERGTWAWNEDGHGDGKIDGMVR